MQAVQRWHVMTWGGYVEWAIAAIPFGGMSAIPVVVNLAATDVIAGADPLTQDQA
jgi:hypothetical protein